LVDPGADSESNKGRRLKKRGERYDSRGLQKARMSGTIEHNDYKVICQRSTEERSSLIF
jgi:hypothetical protein